MCKILALRFSDGTGSVLIPDFLEFFTTPEHIRLAKASTAAVRMSLDLLQMEHEQELEEQELDENEDAFDAKNAIGPLSSSW